MKRFLAIFIAVFTVFSMCISANASFNIYNYTFPDLPIDDTRPYVMIFPTGTSNKWEAYLSPVPFKVSKGNNTYFQVNSADNTMSVTILKAVCNNKTDTEWVITDTGSLSLNYKQVYGNYYSNHDLYDYDGNLIKSKVEFIPNSCDGTSCSAIDLNVDGICDQCGRTLMNLARTPVAPSVDGPNKNYVMFYSGTVYKYTAYTSDVAYTIRGQEYGARYRTYTEPSVNVVRYQSYDGINWEQSYTGTTANDYPGEIGEQLISSTFDWYTEEGEHFFPVPLWEEVEQVTQGEMSGLAQTTGGTMRILVLCGVGCLALLMVLKLFGKRSLLFRS